MRPILIVFAVFAAGVFLGHDYWPKSHHDPAWHFRFHREKMSPVPAETETTNKPPTQHGRILHPPQTN
jgi:hypothetical protein